MHNQLDPERAGLFANNAAGQRLENSDLDRGVVAVAPCPRSLQLIALADRQLDETTALPIALGASVNSDQWATKIKWPYQLIDR